VQFKSLVDTINALMSRALYAESLQSYKTLPKIISEVSFLNAKSGFITWYTKSRMMYPNLPELAVSSTKTPKSGFVGARELVPGNLYYAGSCWRNTWVYLGRTQSKEFVWYYIGNTHILYRSSVNQLISEAEITKQNKRVKPLAMVLEDKDAYVSKECKELIQRNYHVNMTGVDTNNIF
jgi:hypothetical protein